MSKEVARAGLELMAYLHENFKKPYNHNFKEKYNKALDLLINYQNAIFKTIERDIIKQKY